MKSSFCQFFLISSYIFYGKYKIWENFFDSYKSEAGACLVMCLKFPDFEAGRAYELGAYKKKNKYRGGT